MTNLDQKKAAGVPPDPEATLRPGSRDHLWLPAPTLPFLAPPLLPDEIGRLGPYRVLRIIGQGSMGLVLQADDPSLSRPVAVKVMLPELAARPDAREQFLGEARAVAQLQHDNIVAIYHVGDDQGVPYFVMPLLKGVSLEEYLRRGRAVSAGQTLRVAKDVARGLSAAHDRGLVHRDIKPANLWVDATAGGRIKILDFGLARPQGQGSSLTHSGMIVGTPAYMAPEQINGRPEARSDLYSLGAVMYRLLAGRLPYTERDPLELLVAVATQDPPDLAELAPQVPPELAALVMRLLSKNANHRPASAQALLEELKAIGRGGSGPVDASLAAMMPEESTPTERMRSPARLKAVDQTEPARPKARKVEPGEEVAAEEEAGPKTEEIIAPARPRRPRRRDRVGKGWQVAVLLGGLALCAVASAVVLARLLPRGGDRPDKGGGPDQAASKDKPPGLRQPPAGFKALFDGKGLNGWQQLGPSPEAQSQWAASDGVVVCRGVDKGMLRLAREYKDFELELEWRQPRGA